jgi:4-amino-4-deoxy-L-arabinose transferase-like glycosyltransferase
VAGSRFPALLLLLALTVDLGAVLVVRRHGTIETLEDDELEYWGLATNVLHGSLEQHPSRRTLPFPAVIAAARAVAGDRYLPVQVLVTVVVSLSPLLLYGVIRRQLGSERVARLAAVGVAVWPPFVRYGATLYSDSLGVLALLLVLLAWPSPEDVIGVAFGWRRWLGAGALLALCVHVKPLYLVFVPLAAALATMTERGTRRRAAAPSLLVAGCVLAMAPWSAYMTVREGRFILVSANDGETLAGGLNPALLAMREPLRSATPDQRAVWTGPGKWLRPEATGYLSPEERALPYARQSELLSARVVAWVRTHPVDAAYLTGRKLLYMWGVHPFWNGAAQTLLGNLPLLPLVVMAALGWRNGRRRWPALRSFAALPLLSSLVACISWGSWRFRMAADLGLIVLAAAFVAAWRARPRGVAPGLEPPGAGRAVGRRDLAPGSRFAVTRE